MSGFPQHLANGESIRKTMQKDSVQVSRFEDAEHGTITAYDKNDCFSMTGGRQKAAFTMAEVLITLMILGIIAILTLPALTKKVQNYIAVTKLKKAYSEMSQMALNIKTSSDCNDLNCTGLPAYRTPFYDFATMRTKFLELANVKDAKTSSPLRPIRNLKDNNDMWTGFSQSGCFLTKNGFYYCLSGIGVYSPQNGTIRIGVGLEPPEAVKKYIAGRNFFFFGINNKFQVVPMYHASFNTNTLILQDNAYRGAGYCNPNQNEYQYSYSCASRIMIRGWKMDY